MNILSLYVLVLKDDQSVWMDGIQFKECALTVVDRDSFLGSIPAVNDAIVVPSELMAARTMSGKFLIFTNPSGIADDGGWSGVSVIQKEVSVKWEFSVDDASIQAEFDRVQYDTEIGRVLSELASLPTNVEIEPIQAVFPEEW